MATFIDMPKLSDTMTEGVLVKWLKKPGDKIEIGDLLAEVETDKATMEMEAFDSGILGEVYIQEGGKIEVGGRIGVLIEPGEKLPAAGEAPAAAPAPAKSEAPVEAKSAPAAPAAAPVAEPAAAPSGDRLKASPLARKVALEKGVDLSTITGSGPSGRIVEKDVLAAAAAPAPAPKAEAKPAAKAPAPAPVIAPGSVTRVPLTGMRKVIAERLVTSKTTIPHFYLGMEVDAAPILKLRADLNTALEAASQPKLTINDFVLKATAAAVLRVPKVNASWDGDAIVEFGSVHLSVAVAIEDGLITPVIRDAQAKSLSQISAEMKDLAGRARSKKLKPEEYQGGTITVSSLGPFGIESFYAIVNPPQSVILAIGSIVKKPVVGPKGDIVAGDRMTIGFSADHRVIDGAVGAQFLVELRKFLEQPALALV
ncbi:MAG TPA: pyruvate dehydrogenase complex dihydrolipoamide acetyltransferase [Chthoniobacterales bacterium]